jgi:hypothetical protein
MAPSLVPQPAEVQQAFQEELHPGQQSALISWLSFTVTFCIVRVITHRIRRGGGDIHNITMGGLHLHHYLWGITTVSGVGGVALRGDERMRRHPVVAVAYGAGLALIVDEFALLLDLKDVYWAQQGRWSVDLGVSIIGAAGSVLVGLPVLRRLRDNRTHR